MFFHCIVAGSLLESLEYMNVRDEIVTEIFFVGILPLDSTDCNCIVQYRADYVFICSCLSRYTYCAYNLSLMRAKRLDLKTQR